MGLTVIYASDSSFNGGLAIMTIREHLCGFYETKVECVDAYDRVDSPSGHMVCSGCQRITVASGLRRCDTCDKEFINKSKFQDNNYETNCPRCIVEYGLEDDEDV